MRLAPRCCARRSSCACFPAVSKSRRTHTGKWAERGGSESPGRWKGQYMLWRHRVLTRRSWRCSFPEASALGRCRHHAPFPKICDCKRGAVRRRAKMLRDADGSGSTLAADDPQSPQRTHFHDSAHLTARHQPTQQGCACPPETKTNQPSRAHVPPCEHCPALRVSTDTLECYLIYSRTARHRAAQPAGTPDGTGDESTRMRGAGRGTGAHRRRGATVVSLLG